MSLEQKLEENTAALLALSKAIERLMTTPGKVPETAAPTSANKSIFPDATEEAQAPKKPGKASAKSTESSATSGNKPTTADAQHAQSVAAQAKQKAEAAAPAVDMAELRKELSAVVVSVAKMDAEGVVATRAILAEYNAKKAAEVPDDKVAECMAKFKAAKAKLEGKEPEIDEEDFA